MLKKVLALTMILVLTSCSKKLFKEKWLQEEAPETFTARFETTQGNFDIMAKRAWSPKGVDRLYQLIKHDFYTDIALFRVVPNFVVQFGIHNDSLVSKQWRDAKIDDEPVLQKNDSMSISFARAGKRTRTTQIFINLKDNHRLDTTDYNGVVGFPVVAKVINGMETVHKFYKGYGNEPASKQDSIYARGNAYLKRNYPKIDYIKKAYILK